uniref:Uncharacterized protein n=1 Tax=Alexandrium monilatum TaxID=311494 RepID=A0A7S4QAU2_9DINO
MARASRSCSASAPTASSSWWTSQSRADALLAAASLVASPQRDSRRRSSRCSSCTRGSARSTSSSGQSARSRLSSWSTRCVLRALGQPGPQKCALAAAVLAQEEVPAALPQAEDALDPGARTGREPAPVARGLQQLLGARRQVVDGDLEEHRRTCSLARGGPSTHARARGAREEGEET